MMSDFGITFKDLQGRTIDPKLGLGEVPLKYIAHLESLLTAEREANKTCPICMGVVSSTDGAEITCRFCLNKPIKNITTAAQQYAYRMHKENRNLREEKMKAEADLRNAITAQNELHEQIAMYQQRNREAMKQEPVAVIVVNASGQIRLEDMSGRAFDISGFAGGEKLYAAPIPPADVQELQKSLNWLEQHVSASQQGYEQRIAELTRRLAALQAWRQSLVDMDNRGEPDSFIVDCLVIDPTDGAPELTKLLEEARKQAVPEVRKEVWQFALEMERTLKNNEHKGGWKDCEPLWLLSRLKEEVQELHRAIDERDDILGEAADVANFAMMIADISGLLSAAPQPDAAIRAKGN